MDIITRKKAIEINQTWYFTNIPCKNNHLDKRYTNTGICYACKRANIKKDYSKNTSRITKSNKKSYIKNKDKIILRNKNWASLNRDKSNKIKKAYKDKNIEKVRESARLYQKTQRKDPFKRLSKNISKAIWQSLKNKKNSNSWKRFVDYDLNTLIIYLENRFTPEMTWDNYGSYWHLDHIKPLSWFNLELEFKEAWSLKNLQPLEASKNLSKNNRYEG